MSENTSSVKGILDVSMDKIRTVADSDTIIGDPIISGDLTLIPVSKVSFGFATGGSDFASKNSQGKLLFGGGGGAGVSITPVAFLAVKDGDVKVVSVNDTSTPVDMVISAIPELVEKIKGLFNKKKDKKEAE